MSDAEINSGRDQSQQRVERVLSLIRLLVETQRPLTREAIFAVMSADYPDDSEATKRKFERDKKAVRAFMDITTSGEDGDEDTGYFINRDTELEIGLTLTAEEAAILSIAIEQAYSDEHALRLLTSAAGLVPKSEHAGHARDYLRVSPLSSNLRTLLEACANCRRVAFSYKKPSETHQRIRTLDVWSLIGHNGHWYVGGWDADTDAIRVFRVDRIRENVTDVGAATHKANSSFDIRSEVIREHSDTSRALVHVRAGTCQMLRQRAISCEVAADGWDLLTLDCRDIDATAGLITRFGNNARIEAPSELLERVIERLENAARTEDA